MVSASSFKTIAATVDMNINYKQTYLLHDMSVYINTA